jgi:hypothetical protein
VKNPAEILNENPGSLIFARHAEGLARSGNVDEALEILSSGINANPEYAAGYSVLAGININQGLHEAAIEHLEKALDLEPQSPKDLLNLGKYLIDSEPEKAKEHLWKARRYEPESPETETALNEAISKIGGPGTDESPAAAPPAKKKVRARSGLDLLRPIDVTDDTKGGIIVDEVENDMPEQETDAGDPFAEMLDDVSASDDAPIAEESADMPDDAAEQDENAAETEEESVVSEEPDMMVDDLTEQPMDEADAIAPEDETDVMGEDPADETGTEDDLPGDETSEIDEEPVDQAEMSDDLPGDGIEPVAGEEFGEEFGNAEVELMPETENALSEMFGETETPADADAIAPEDETDVRGEAPADETDAAEELPEDGIEPVAGEEFGEEFGDSEVELMPETENALSDIPGETETPAETDAIAPEAEAAEAAETLGEVIEPDTAEEILDETDSEDDDSDEDDDIMKELAMLSDEEEEEEEEEEEDDEIVEVSEEIPGYSNILDEDIPKSPDTLINPADAGVLEIDDEDSNYDISQFEQDTSEENGEEPVLADDERAELLEIEKNSEDGKKKPKSEDSVDIPTDIPEISGNSDVPGGASSQAVPEEILTENLYGDLSKDELEVLSETDVEPDDEGKHLEIETNEGIDYSDILYGQEPSIESEDHSTQSPGHITLAPSNDISAELLPEEPSFEDIPAQDLDIADIQDGSSYTDTIESIDSEIQDSPETSEIIADNVTNVGDVEDSGNFPSAPQNSAWDIPADLEDAPDDTADAEPEDAALPEVTGEVNLEDISDEISEAIPEKIEEDTTEEEISAEQKIENLTANEIDIEDTSGELSYADILETGNSEITESADDISGDISNDVSEEAPADAVEDITQNSAWDIPTDLEDAPDDTTAAEPEDTAQPEVTGEFDIEDMSDEISETIPEETIEGTAEEELSAEQEIENLTANEIDIEDTSGELSYTDILESDNAEITESEDDISGEISDDIPEEAPADAVEDITQNSAWDIPADLEDAPDDAADAEPEDEAQPEVTGEFDIEDMSGEVSDDVPEALAEDNTGDEQEIGDLSIRDIDDDVLGEDSSNDESMSNGSHYLGLPVDDEEINDVENSSIGDLIYDYVAAMKETNVESGTEQSESPSVSGTSDPSVEDSDVELDLNGDISYDYEADDETPPDGEATATMAEIFVSQGLTPRAIEIYKVLLEQKPESEEIKSRLEELQITLDTQSGDE